MGTDDLSLDEIVNSTVELAPSPSSFYLEIISLTPPSIESFPPLELKTLPKHLKYAYLGEQKTLSFIVAFDLTDRKQEDLMTILRKYRKAIGWMLTDIKG